MVLGMEVELGPGDFVLDGDPASPGPPPQKGAEAPSPIFGPFLLWPNGWMHQDATWYGARPQLRGHCVRCMTHPPSQKEGGALQIVGPYLLRLNGWMDQYRSWHGSRPQPRRRCVRWGVRTPAPSPKRGRSPFPIFGPFPFRSNGWMHQDATWYGGRPQQPLLMGTQPPFPKRERSPPIFGPCLLRPNGYIDQDDTWYGGRPQPSRLYVRWGPGAQLPSSKRGLRPLFEEGSWAPGPHLT